MASYLHARRKPSPASTNLTTREEPFTKPKNPTTKNHASPKIAQRRRRVLALALPLVSVVLAWIFLGQKQNQEEKISNPADGSTPIILKQAEGSPTVPCQLKPTRFRTNHLITPLALSDAKPVFSWALELLSSDMKKTNVNHYQTAYRILCTLPTDDKTVLWDSGKVTSGETLQIEYEGTPLWSLQRVVWQVFVWDQHDQECSSQSSWFETGLLTPEAWGKSQWIARSSSGPLANASLCEMMQETEENKAPRFRRTLDNPLPSADLTQIRAYIVGLGYYQLFINGQRVGDALLDPGWTTYSKRVFYSAYNVTSHFVDNQNSNGQQHVIGVELGNGWWNPFPLNLFNKTEFNVRTNLVQEQGFVSTPPMFRLLIVGFKADGSTVTLAQSSAGDAHNEWRASGSPTTLNNIFLGEQWDARLEPKFDKWTTPQYDTFSWLSFWRPAALVSNDVTKKLGKLQAQPIPPIRRQQTLPSTLLSTRPGDGDTNILVFDTSINHAGSCRIQLQGDYPQLVGQQIHLLYGELLFRNGTVNGLTGVVGQLKSHQRPKASPCQPDIAFQQDVVTLGRGPLDWTPSWSWHGFRYVEVTLPSSIQFEDFALECFTMRTDLEVIATNFSSSDPWLSELRTLVRNTFDSNLMGVLSDCPARERFGYGGDALGAGEAALSIYDFGAFLRKRLLDFNDAQRSNNGKRTGFTETAPYVGIADGGLGPGTGPIGWQTFQPEGLLWMYKYYGDLKTMRQSFSYTRTYIDLLDSSPEGIENGLGDWMPVDKTDLKFTGLGFQRMSYLAFANMTDLLGLSSDVALHYRLKAANLATEINKRFLVGADPLSRIRSHLKYWFLGGNQVGDYRVGTKERAGQVTQTGQAMALFNGFIESDQNLKRQVLDRLAENIRASSDLKGAGECSEMSPFQPDCFLAQGGPGPHMTTGLFGVKWLLIALADAGLNDLAYEVVTTKSYPGLRWMTNNPFTNATTIWESFFFSDDMYSHNHPMFGSTEVWLLQSVVGLQPHPSARGMNHILIRPNPPSQLQHAAASFESPRGLISASWERGTNNAFKLEVTIPPNCRATIHVPVSSRTARVLQDGLEATVRWIPSLASPDRGSAAIEIGSGHHKFESELLGSRTSVQ